MKLSLVLCSRNDRYQGNSRWRLETALNYVGARVEELGRSADVEVIVSDWGSETPLHEVVALAPAAVRIVSFLWVPPGLARARQQDSTFPEVLALNAAVRRSAGAFIGRIDQDTLVGSRFLSFFFDLAEGRRALGQAGASAETALLFANRRGLPFRFVEQVPTAAQVDRFVQRFGAGLPVWDRNAATGHVFWTSYVGIWLAHRNLWWEAGGYDERFIYYNWMETDMICRLRQKYPVVDLGALTDQDFYHLEHDNPRSLALAGRPRRRNNPNVILTAPAPTLHPNGAEWGLNDVVLTTARGRSVSHRSEAAAGFPALLARMAVADAVDRLAIRAGRMTRSAARYQPRKVAAELLGRAGLLATARRLRLRARLFADADVRRLRREDCDRFGRFSREGAGGIRVSLLGPPPGSRVALVVSSRCPTIEGELVIIKALQLAGLTPVVLLEDERRWLRPFYEMAGVAGIHLWSEFLSSRNYGRQAAALASRCESVDALMALTHEGVRVGMIATCTALRRMRVGVLDWSVPAVRERLVRGLAASMAAVEQARAILAAVRPHMVLTPPEYTPHGELFETCIAAGIDTIAHDQAHRNDSVVFKRYTAANRDSHLTTLSEESWGTVRALQWTPEHSSRLDREMTASYRAGDWYGTPWSDGAPTSRTDIRQALGLDAGRLTAAIFPHMLWDAPVMWGRPVFPTYQDWLVETVRAACRNDALDWVIKIHPAHVRQAQEGYGGDPAEVQVLRDAVGSFPRHVKYLPADTPVSTHALLSAVDYCLTVRGTVGVEAARLGVPVLTAGPARYSGLGFTIDSDSREAYLDRLARIDTLPALSTGARELAERFAYGLFLLRPLRITSMCRSQDDPDRVRITVSSEREWRSAPDVSALAAWLGSRHEDLLNPA